MVASSDGTESRFNVTLQRQVKDIGYALLVVLGRTRLGQLVEHVGGVGGRRRGVHFGVLVQEGGLERHPLLEVELLLTGWRREIRILGLSRARAGFACDSHF